MPAKRLFAVRVAYHRLVRKVHHRLHPLPWAAGRGDPPDFPIVAVERSSPLQRAPTGAIAAHTEEKTHNLRLAAAKLNHLVMQPGEVFSFCRTVGPTCRGGGYLPALELHDGEMQASIGGGLCQLSNLLLLLAIEANAEIVERHRHSFDLFRDVERAVPFGCGATVFYNYVDFQFRSRLSSPLLLEVAVQPPLLVARLRAREPLPFQARIVETDHRFFRSGDRIYRANRIWREVQWVGGRGADRELLFENCCRVMYPADDLVSKQTDA
jgi:vancomycin resistance protein VanW